MSEPENFPVYEPGPDPSSGPPRHPVAAGHLTGRVEDPTTRVESHGDDFGSETVLSFRLLVPDGSPRDVELRGLSIVGAVREGDWVEVVDRSRAGRYEVSALQNLTTGAEVRAVGSSRSPGARVFKVVFAIVFVAVLLFIAWVALSIFGIVDAPWPFALDS